jgi:FkbM family methyltransferase
LFPDAEIISLEPESSNYEMLLKNTGKHKTITPIKAGLWNKSCFLRIIKADSGNWGFRTEEVETETPDTVKAFSIQNIMNENGWHTIDILKMDIEGAESQVFKHNTETWLPKVKMVFLELHDNIDRQCSKAVFRAITKYDFSVDIWGENIILINNAYR